MPEFKYTAVDQNGILLNGKMYEADKMALVRRLKLNDLTPIEIRQMSSNRKKGKSEFEANDDDLERIAELDKMTKNSKKRMKAVSSQGKKKQKITRRVTERDVVVFTKNFHALKKAGYNNMHALDVLADGIKNEYFRDIIIQIRDGVEGGEYMYKTLQLFPDVFPYMYVNLVRVGEISGSLEDALFQAATYLDESTQLKRKIRSILIPNIIQFVATLVLLFVGTLYLVPTMQSVLDQVGSKDRLPTLTVKFANWLQNFRGHWYIPVMFIVAFIILYFVYRATPSGRFKTDQYKYKLLIFGELIFLMDFSKFIDAMLLNLKNGMRIQEALSISRNVNDNYMFKALVQKSIDNIIQGDSWVEPFEEANVASPMILEMIKTGMKTDLITMLEKLSEYLKYDINRALDRVIKILPQVLMAIVGLLLIFVVLVVLVPAIKMYMGGWLLSAAGV